MLWNKIGSGSGGGDDGVGGGDCSIGGGDCSVTTTIEFGGGSGGGRKLRHRRIRLAAAVA
jgi:hypothetical protein